MDLIFDQLNRVNSKEGDTYTHTSRLQPCGSFYLDETNKENYWAAYCNAVKKNIVLGLTEKPDNISPLRGDVDLKFDLDKGSKRKYTVKHIKTLMKYYQDIIEEIVPADKFNNKMTYCVILEREKPRKEAGKIIDGFHYHFPFFICNSYIQNGMIRDKVLQRATEDKLFRELGHLKTINDVIDKIATKTWTMYGSTKPDSTDKTKIIEPFRATLCFDNNLDEISLDEMFKDEYGELLAQGKKCRLSYYLPRLLSIRNVEDKETPLIESIEKLDPSKRKKNKKEFCLRSTEHALADLKVIEDGSLIDMLSEERAERYESWMDVGWTLYCIGQGCEKALDMWIEFSAKASNYKDGECEKLWNKMVIKETSFGVKTIGTIKAMAREDSPDKYAEWQKYNLRNIMMKCLRNKKPSHYDVACVVHKLYENRFLCSSSKGDQWYEFKDHRWNFVDDGVSIRKLLSQEVAALFNDFSNEMRDQRNKYDQESTNYKEFEEKRVRSFNVDCLLGDSPFVDKVLKMCKMLFHDQKFMTKIDENKELIGFENGVYDLKLGIFRDGRPDDYITISTGINYFDYDQDSEEVKEVEDFLKKIFVNPNIYNYALDSISSCFRGGNTNKKFFVLTGGTHGGKSAFTGLVEKTFGGYRHNFPRETFVAGKTSSGAKPELASVRGKRIAFAKELAKNEKLHIGMIKEMTGNDSFFARNLYEKGGDITPMFTLFLMCNDPPEVPAQDEATWGRIRVIPCESYFPEDPSEVPDSEEERIKRKIFMRDPYLDDKLSQMKEPFACLLLERYKKVKVTGLYEPKEVRLSTDRYKNNNDIYQQFINDKLEITKEKTDFLRLMDVYSEFKSWYEESYPSYAKEKISKPVMKSELERRIGAVNSQNRWLCLKFKRDDEDDKLVKKKNKADKYEASESESESDDE
jgi:P4 family phage/plasmid primase-like protien